MIDETGQVAAVYVQTNEPDANRVLAFGFLCRRDAHKLTFDSDPPAPVPL